MTKKTIPLSRAKTAYGLLSEIRRLILDEPKRYDQTDVLRTRPLYGTGSYWPSCGTVGCVAGWATTLKGKPSRDGWKTLMRARHILGLDAQQADDLFDGGAAGHDPQKPGHARRGAYHIAAFQVAHAKQLKAKKL